MLQRNQTLKNYQKIDVERNRQQNLGNSSAKKMYDSLLADLGNHQNMHAVIILIFHLYMISI